MAASAATRQFVWAMRIFLVIYLLGATLFFLRPDETFYLINIGPKVFKAYDEIPMPTERFWLVLATSMMVMLALCSLYSSIYPKAGSYVVIHLASKAASTGGFVFMFLQSHRYFAYLAGAAVDGIVFAVVLVLYLRNLTQLPKLPEEAKANAGGGS